MLTNVSSAGFIVVKSISALSAIAFVVGLILFIAWASKNLKKDKLLKLSVYLLIVGFIVCILAKAFGGYGLGHKKFYKDYKDSTKWCQEKCGK